MLLADAVFSLLLAAAFGVLLSAAFRLRSPWAAPWALFLVLFLFTWAGGVWLAPMGPPVLGVHWMSFLLFGLFLMLLIAASSRPRLPRERHDEELAEELASEQAALGLTAFFWVLVVGLGVAILVGYA